MKKRNVSIFARSFGGILVVALFVVACAGTSGAAHKTSASTPTQVATSEEATPQALEQTPAAGAIEVHVTLLEYKIFSTVTVFHVHVPYYFVVTNSGHDLHEFMIMPDNPDGSPASPEVQYKGMLMEVEPILPGTTQRINYTFSPAFTTHYEIACQMGRHYQAGMKLLIRVTS